MKVHTLLINACRFLKDVVFGVIWDLHSVVDEETKVLRNMTRCLRYDSIEE
jgi:hypothetical protein